MTDHGITRDLEALVGGIGGDHERNRSKPFVQILGTIDCAQLDEQRRADCRVRKSGMLDRTRIQHDRTERASGFEPP